MTVLPDPNEFTTTMGMNSANGIQLHPDVRDRFWGYEVRMTQGRNGVSAVIRLGSYAVSLWFAVAGVMMLIWPVANLAAVNGAQSAIAITAFCLSAIAAHICATHCPVRVQVDTAAGELREVVDRRFGGEVVLARYGLDAVAQVEVVSSDRTPSLGQVHVRINGYGVVPVGDGALSALRPLRDRLAAECGLDNCDARPAVWSGPLAA